jgi:hypothetical protein
MDWLKEIIAELTDEQLEKVKQELPKHFVAKDQYNKKVDELKLKSDEYGTLSKQLEDNKTLMGDLQKKAELTDEYKTKLEQQVSAFDSYKADADKRVDQMLKRSAIEKSLLASKAAPDAVDLLLNEFNLDDIKLSEKGEVLGFNEILAPIQEKRKSLFVTESMSTPNTQTHEGAEANTEYNKIAAAMGIPQAQTK